MALVTLVTSIIAIGGPIRFSSAPRCRWTVKAQLAKDAPLYLEVDVYADKAP